ncbi:MAG: helix-turn-helix domain-containing protein, partial [Deltaproteobacteria bacterium]|nr:helix-turn-helix domain-containing protein [Deltaproteobacteria bacterium]
MARDNRFTSLTPAVEQAAEILRYLATEPALRAGLAQIARAVDINKSKTHVILDALNRAGFVRKDPTSKLYCLGLGLVPIALTALQNASYKDAVRPILAELAEETRVSALFGLV